MSARPFRETLSNIRQGALDDELTTALNQLVNAVRETNQPGMLTLKLKLKPTKGLAIEIEDEISLKEPELGKPSTLLFPTNEGNLQVQNPMQKSLDLTVVQDGGVKSLTTVNIAGAPAALNTVPGASTGT